MLFELGQGQEISFAAFITASEGFVVGMFEGMVSKAGLGGEFQAAFREIANKRRLFSMDSDVILKGVRSLEGFVTTFIWAAERTIIEVNNAVFSDFRFVFENFTAATKSTAITLFVVLEELLTKVRRLGIRSTHN